TEAIPGRDQLPFSVRWTGQLDVPSNGVRTFLLEAAGPARLTLDGAELLATDGSAESFLARGMHAIQVEYTRPEARVPRLRLSWQREPGAALEVVNASGAEPRAGLAHGLELALGLVALALIGWWMWRRRAWWPLVPLAFAVYGAAQLWPLLGRTSILSGLDDWLVYESSARDILFNGPLMADGQDHAAPYYGQPLYPYVLAFAHVLTGEGLFPPLVLQFAALGGVVVLSGVLARRAFPQWSQASTFAMGGLGLFMAVQNEYWRTARQLFTENLYTPLVLCSLIVLVSLAARRAPPRWWQLLLTGALLGLTAVARAQFLACVPFGLLVLVLAWRRRALNAVVLVGAGLVFAVAPVTARNWIVSGQFVPISASGGASLLEFHRPPPGLVDNDAVARDPLFNAMHLDTQTRTVLAFAEKDPLGYLQTWLPLGAHSLGLQGRNDPGVYWPLFVAVLLYLAAFA